MKIATWNVNSINIRKKQLIEWLNKEKPDVVLLQEIKCENHKFPKEEIGECGYNIAVHGEKTFNGVAILSKSPIDEFYTDFLDNPLPKQARYIEAVISLKEKAIRVASVYVPNGESLDSDKFQNKLKFLDALHKHLESLLELNEITFIGGDFNIAPQNIDCFNIDEMYDSVLFDLKVRTKFRSILNLGFYNSLKLTDSKKQQFSWWDYRKGAWHKNQGMLIDHILLSPEAADYLESTSIESRMRGLIRPSDHVPVVAILNSKFYL